MLDASQHSRNWPPSSHEPFSGRSILFSPAFTVNLRSDVFLSAYLAGVILLGAFGAGGGPFMAGQSPVAIASVASTVTMYSPGGSDLSIPTVITYRPSGPIVAIP